VGWHLALVQHLPQKLVCGVVGERDAIYCKQRQGAQVHLAVQSQGQQVHESASEAPKCQVHVCALLLRITVADEDCVPNLPVVDVPSGVRQKTLPDPSRPCRSHAGPRPLPTASIRVHIAPLSQD
jgi:hypothetical protein